VLIRVTSDITVVSCEILQHGSLKCVKTVSGEPILKILELIDRQGHSNIYNIIKEPCIDAEHPRQGDVVCTLPVDRDQGDLFRRILVLRKQAQTRNSTCVYQLVTCAWEFVERVTTWGDLQTVQIG
jgi:hypothetical protein